MQKSIHTKNSIAIDFKDKQLEKTQVSINSQRVIVLEV